MVLPNSASISIASNVPRKLCNCIVVTPAWLVPRGLSRTNRDLYSNVLSSSSQVQTGVVRVAGLTESACPVARRTPCECGAILTVEVAICPTAIAEYAREEN